MSIAFYISGHGYGHASREVEIINALGRILPEPVIIRSAVEPGLLARTLRVPYVLRPGACDTGVVQTTSVAHDDAATIDAAMRFYADFDARVAAETDALTADRLRLVVGDIAPIAFEVAHRLGVPGVAIANFTWDWIYEAHPGFSERAAPVIETIRRAYRKATVALQLPFSAGFDVFPHVTPLPLVARRPTRTREETRAHFGLPKDGPAALLSFGGYGMPGLDLDHVDCRSDWTIVTTDRTSPDTVAPPHHVVFVPSAALADGRVRYEDLVAAVDVVITKPGYGIIAECIAARTPMLYTSRGHFREYELLVGTMPRFLRCRYIDHADLFGGRWREALEAVHAQPAPPETLGLDGADVAADTLAALARGA